MSGALLNHTTQIDAGKTAMEIVGELALHKCLHINLETDGLGSFTGVVFGVMVGDSEQAFRLPVNTDACYEALKKHNHEGRIPGRFVNKDQARRVAWRIVKNWVMAQIAIIESGMVRTEQVFLPYLLLDGGKQTLFQKMEQRFLELPEGRL